MKKTAPNEVKRGQTISFRVPSDTPDHILKHLQRLKEMERRNFSSKIAEFVLQGVGNAYSREKETITVPLPKSLSKAQRDWLKHEHSEVILGSIIYQLIADPIRATSLLAAFNSNSVDINDALYLQEETAASIEKEVVGHNPNNHVQEINNPKDLSNIDDDLNSFSLEEVRIKSQESKELIEEKFEENADELLGAFLAQMNK